MTGEGRAGEAAPQSAQHVRRQEELVRAVQVSGVAGRGAAARLWLSCSRSRALRPDRSGCSSGAKLGNSQGQGGCSHSPRLPFLPLRGEFTHRVPVEGWSLAWRAPNPTIPVLGHWDVVRSSQTSFPERSLSHYGFLCRVGPREVSLSPSWQGVGAVPAVRATPPGGATEQGLRELDPLPLMRPDSEDGLGVVSGLGDLKNAFTLLCASVFVCELGPQRARE